MKVFARQFIHLFSLTLLLVLISVLYQSNGSNIGSYLGVSIPLWFVVSLSIPILHQVFVVLAWRAELYHRTLTHWWRPCLYDLHRRLFHHVRLPPAVRHPACHLQPP